MEGSNRLSIYSRIGKVIPKGDNKWEKGKLICICASKNMSELIRMVRAIASLIKLRRQMLEIIINKVTWRICSADH